MNNYKTQCALFYVPAGFFSSFRLPLAIFISILVKKLEAIGRKESASIFLQVVSFLMIAPHTLENKQGMSFAYLRFAEKRGSLWCAENISLPIKSHTSVLTENIRAPPGASDNTPRSPLSPLLLRFLLSLYF